MQVEVLGRLSPAEQAKLGRLILNIFAEESGGVLGPEGSVYEFDRFEHHSSFSPFAPYEGIAFVWGRRTTETGWSSIGVPMRLSWANDFSLDAIRAVAREVHANWEKVQAGSATLQARYLKAYCLVQVETLLGTFPHFDSLPAIEYCKVCAEQGRRSAARKLMPLSSDKGLTVALVGVCDNHAADWWRAADWDGRHLAWTRDSSIVRLVDDQAVA